MLEALEEFFAPEHSLRLVGKKHASNLVKKLSDDVEGAKEIRYNLLQSRDVSMVMRH